MDGAAFGMGEAVGDPSMLGFTEVKSRKYMMRRGVNRNREVVEEKEDPVCDLTIPWVPLVGDRRKVRKWAQARKGGGIYTKLGYAYFSYGTYGPCGIEF